MGAKSTKKADEKSVSDQIDKDMYADAVIERELIKLLLLGAGGSGKSTLFKQMIKLYGDGFTAKDLMLYVPMIHNNTIKAMKELCYQSNKLGIPGCKVQGDEAKKSLQFMENVKETDAVNGEIAKHIKILWADPGIKATFAQRSKFQLMDTSDYFFESIDRISVSKFIPTDEDLIRCRVRTTGIVENHFKITDNRFLMVDVGGQRNERKKWIHCFDGVTAVIYVCGISSYDEVLYEDGKTNRLDEALDLFDETCHTKFFAKTSFILFLNKSDLFEDKLARVPFTEDVCPAAKDYKGDPTSVAEVFEYIQKLFVDRYHMDKLYVHYTCATNSDNVSLVFSAVKDIIIHHHLADSGLV